MPGKGQPRLPPGLVQTRAADSAPAAAGASLTANRNMFLRMSVPPSPARLVFGRGEPFYVNVNGVCAQYPHRAGAPRAGVPVDVSASAPTSEGLHGSRQLAQVAAAARWHSARPTRGVARRLCGQIPRIFAFEAANSSSVRMPWSLRAASCLICSICELSAASGAAASGAAGSSAGAGAGGAWSCLVLVLVGRGAPLRGLCSHVGRGPGHDRGRRHSCKGSTSLERHVNRLLLCWRLRRRTIRREWCGFVDLSRGRRPRRPLPLR